MACLVDLDPKHRVLRVTVISRVLTDEGPTEMYQLVELSQVERVPICAKTIRNLAASKPAVAAGASRLIVDKQDIAFGLSRMFRVELGSGGWTTARRPLTG
jgi:hypothetical protein